MICPIPPVSGSFRTLSSTTVQHLLTTMSSGDPESSQPFLAFTEESEASTPVFQLLHHIKWDVEVSGRYSRSDYTSFMLGIIGNGRLFPDLGAIDCQRR